MMLGVSVAALAGYILGSIPFGIVIARLFGLGDLRQIGSGNIGATNVLRTGNKLAALLTLAGDAGKGALAVIVARAIFGDIAALIAGLAAILGHLYPIFIGFKGGKGVATFLGTLLAVSFPVGAMACATWLVVAALFRYSSLAGMTSAALAPVFAAYVHSWLGALVMAIMAALIIAKHRENIARLRAGTESKIGQKS